jgi:hypothetical protein
MKAATTRRGSSRMPSPGTDRPGIISTTARANGFVVALECICIADIARVPQYLDAGQQFDVARRAAGFHHTDAIALVGRAIFGPVLLQRVLRRGLVGETGLLVAAEHDGSLSRSLATWPDLERGRAAATTARDLRSRWRLPRLPLLVSHVGGKIA